MQTGSPLYDPRVIERFAERLYEKARSFVVGSVVVGAALGSGFGAVPLTPLGESWPIPAIFGFATLLVGGIVGAMCGYVIGDTRAFGYKLQAQTALLNLQIERNTYAAAQVGGRPAPSREASPRPVSTPHPPTRAPAPTPPASVRPPGAVAQPPVSG